MRKRNRIRKRIRRRWKMEKEIERGRQNRLGEDYRVRSERGRGVREGFRGRKKEKTEKRRREQE